MVFLQGTRDISLLIHLFKMEEMYLLLEQKKRGAIFKLNTSKRNFPLISKFSQFERLMWSQWHKAGDCLLYLHVDLGGVNAASQLLSNALGLLTNFFKPIEIMKWMGCIYDLTKITCLVKCLGMTYFVKWRYLDKLNWKSADL